MKRNWIKFGVSFLPGFWLGFFRWVYPKKNRRVFFWYLPGFLNPGEDYLSHYNCRHLVTALSGRFSSLRHKYISTFIGHHGILSYQLVVPMGDNSCNSVSPTGFTDCLLCGILWITLLWSLEITQSRFDSAVFSFHILSATIVPSVYCWGKHPDYT